MITTLASYRFTKTWFDTKNDWANYPPTVYTCPSCLSETKLTRGDLESSIDRQHEPERQLYLRGLKNACSWVWRDMFQAVHPFRCADCDRFVLLGFERSRYRRTGHMFTLGMVGEEPETKGGRSSSGPKRQSGEVPK